jgi:ATP-dependent Clp protease, protease subunit
MKYLEIYCKMAHGMLSIDKPKFITRAKEILFTKASLNKFMADYCDQPVEKIAADTDRDFFMTPYEALDYGLIDEVLKTKTSHIPMPAMPSLRG